MTRHSALNRYSTMTALLLVALLCASCGRLPAESAGPVSSQAKNPFDVDGTSDSVDIAGVVVTSDATVVPPVDGDIDGSESATQTTTSEIDGDSAPADARPADPPANDPPAAPVTPKPVQKEDPVVPDTGDRHSVALGEALSTIAAKYGITTQALKDFNGLDSDDIIEGQVLRIPQR